MEYMQTCLKHKGVGIKMKNKKNSVLKMQYKLIPMMVKAAPIIFFINIAVAILHGTSWGVITMMQQLFFDQVILVAENNAALNDVIKAFIFLGGSYIVCHVLNGVGNFITFTMDKKIEGKLSLKIHEKIARLAAIDFEDTNKLDDINKAEQGKNNAVGFVSVFISIFTFYIPYFIFMGAYLFSLKPTLVISLVLVFIPTALTQIIKTKVFTKLEDESVNARREYEYYEECIIGREYFKETRLLGGFQFFKKKYIETLKILQKLKFKATMKSNLIELSMRMVSVIGYIAILLMIFSALMNKEISVGAFAAIFNSIGMLYSIMEEIVCQHIGNIAKDLGTVENYINFIGMEETKGNISVAPKWNDIVLENVSFSYPKSEKLAVDNVSITLKKGETVAIVGQNGSGKSTLLRLIIGLYFPSKGSVIMDGNDTREYTRDVLYKNTSAVFQKVQKYQMPFEDNIIMSDYSKKHDESMLDGISEMAGLDKNDSTFTDGYKTMLSREFDGIDLSGGQWQRIAIARGDFKDSNLIVLDEPTAAIDPYEETRLFGQFKIMAENRTTVLVTHRLGSVKIADRIIVMKNGKIIEEGTHEMLMLNNSEYKTLYQTQEQWYQNELKENKILN
jgi:ATP-binding cassette, subfamily B, bacterial